MSPSSSPNALTNRITFLKDVPPFAALGAPDLATMAADFRPKTYKKDELIFRQDDDSRSLYVVAEGQVRIFRLSPAGNETTINIFSTGDIIGELAALDDQPRSAEAKATTPCILLEMAQDKLLLHMQNLSGLALGMSKLLAGKLRWTAAYAETIAQYDAAGRLLHILLLYNEQFGREVEVGQRYDLELNMSQADLASLVGVRREWVNRQLQEWRRRGLIKFNAGTLTILNLPLVRQERDSRIEALGGDW